MSAAPQGLRVIAPLYNGVADEVAAADALLNRDLVDLAIYDSARGSCIWHGRSAAEDRNVFSKSLDNVFCRAGSLLARAVDQPPVVSSDAKPYKDTVKQFAKNGSELSFLVTSVSMKAYALLNKLCRGGHEWSVAWRKTHGDAIADQPAGAGLTFQRHPNNPGSYFADPFVFARDGRHYLFVEEYLYASNKGVISLITIGDDGKLSPSRMVLERPYHLSYPFVFEHDGEIYMIPETGDARRVELYRADRFPDRWSLHSVLIDNIAAYDVTLCEARRPSLALHGDGPMAKLELGHARDFSCRRNSRGLGPRWATIQCSSIRPARGRRVHVSSLRHTLAAGSRQFRHLWRKPVAMPDR